MRERTARLRRVIAVDDGTGSAARAELYEEVVAGSSPEPRIARSRQRLASYKVPRLLRVVDGVPRAPNDYASARKLFEPAD